MGAACATLPKTFVCGEVGLTDEDATNEMVRRLLPLLVQRIVSSRFQEDHRYADSFRWYRPG